MNESSPRASSHAPTFARSRAFVPETYEPVPRAVDRRVPRDRVVPRSPPRRRRLRTIRSIGAAASGTPGRARKRHRAWGVVVCVG